MTCFDQSNIAYSNYWVTHGEMPSANASALKCVNQTNPSAYAVVLACGNGEKGEDLKKKAADYFHETFPMYWTGARFDVPHLYINSVEQVINLNGSDIWAFTQQLCNAGATLPLCWPGVLNDD